MYYDAMQTAVERDALTRFGAALSDPTRVEILLLLSDGHASPAELARSCPTIWRACAAAASYWSNPKAAGSAMSLPIRESRTPSTIFSALS